MELLGFGDTPESQFRDPAFVKSQHPGFVDLLEDNKFLGVGDKYLCSDLIVKVRYRYIGYYFLDSNQLTHNQALRVILGGPLSINILQNSSRSRIKRYGFRKIAPPLLAFLATVVSQLKLLLFLPLISFQIYFLLYGTGSFESDPEGQEEYQVFFMDRLVEIHALGHKAREHIFGFLEEEVYGFRRKKATAEQTRQKKFSEARLQEIRTQAALEDAEEQDGEGGGDKMDEGGEGGEGGEEGEGGEGGEEGEEGEGGEEGEEGEGGEGGEEGEGEGES